jgi:hypothetical protein
MEYRDDEMALFESVLARIVSDGSLGRFSRAHVKETDRVKQLGFYVDLDDQMRVRSTPSQVTSVLAKDHLNFARDVLETLRPVGPSASASGPHPSWSVQRMAPMSLGDSPISASLPPNSLPVLQATRRRI